MFIILYDNKSGHLTCFQFNVNFVVSKQPYDGFEMKFAKPLGDFSLESILSTKPSYIEYEKESYYKNILDDNPLYK